MPDSPAGSCRCAAVQDRDRAKLYHVLYRAAGRPQKGQQNERVAENKWRRGWA